MLGLIAVSLVLEGCCDHEQGADDTFVLNVQEILG